MTWPQSKLEDLAASDKYSFVGGPFGSKLTSRDYVPTGIPVIRGTNLGGGRFLEMSGFVYVSEEKVRRDLSSNLAHSGDLVFTQRGTLGQVAIVPTEGVSNEYVVSQSQMKLTVDERKADARFIYYYFTSRPAVERIANLVSSSGVPHINLTVLRNFEVPVPPPCVQRRIADILSAYDDLIENNRRRIQLLEESARLLYKEWFVHLRFPGHEHVEVIDGVPEGWERSTLPECIEMNPREGTKKGGTIRCIPMAALSTSGMMVDLAESEQRTKPTGVKFRNGDTLLARITPCLENGKTGFVGFLNEGEVACGSTEFIVMRGKLVGPYFTYCLARSHHFRGKAIASMTGSSGRQRVQPSAFADYTVAVPPPVLANEFHAACEPIFSQVTTLQRQIRSASHARDLLLPRLMNGEVAV